MISWFEKHNKISWAITLLGAILIYYFSSIEFGPPAGKQNLLAVIYHISAFFMLSLFLLISSIKREKTKLIPLAILLSINYAILDELHQFFVMGRASTLSDVFLDTIGIVFSLMIYLIFTLKKKSLETLKN